MEERTFLLKKDQKVNLDSIKIWEWLSNVSYSSESIGAEESLSVCYCFSGCYESNTSSRVWFIA